MISVTYDRPTAAPESLECDACAVLIHESEAPYRVISGNEAAGTLFGVRPPALISRGVIGLLKGVIPDFAAVAGDRLSGSISSLDRRVSRATRCSSVPVLFEGRSVSLSAFWFECESERASADPDPLFRETFRLLTTPACVIDPVQHAVICFNRQFSETWNITPETILSDPAALLISSLIRSAESIARDVNDVPRYFRLQHDEYRSDRTLHLRDGNAIRCTMQAVAGSNDIPHRYLAVFSRDDIRRTVQINEAVSRFKMLTPRQRLVVQRVVAGMTNSAIAYELGICTKTVEKHRGAAMQKLKLQNVPDLVRLLQLVEEGRNTVSQ